MNIITGLCGLVVWTGNSWREKFGERGKKKEKWNQREKQAKVR